MRTVRVEILSVAAVTVQAMMGHNEPKEELFTTVNAEATMIAGVMPLWCRCLAGD